MQEYKPGEIVPQSGVIRSHDPVHSDMPHEVTVDQGSALFDVSGPQGDQFPAHSSSQARLRSGPLKEPEVAPM
jgi:hypothetical protein